MLRRLALSVATIAFLLSGCVSSPVSEGETISSAPETFTAIADNRIPAPLTTDTYHFLGKPDLTPTPPTAYEPLRVPVFSVFDAQVSGGQTLRDTWNVTLAQDVEGFVGNWTVFVEVEGGSLVGNPFPTAQGCFWSFNVVVGATDSLSGELADSYLLGCGAAGPQVPPGLYELSMPFALSDVVWPAGTVLHFEFHTNEPVQRSPGVTVELLTAAINQDSRIQVYGLELPLDPGLLLAT